MTPLNAVIQGVIQGLTEFLPISSSGHLSLFQYFTGQNEQSGIMFSIFLHMGTLLAVLIAFYKTVFSLIKEVIDTIVDLFKGRFALKGFFRDASPSRRMIILLIVSLIPMLLSLYLLNIVKQVSTDNDIIVEGGCFIITSIMLFLADSCVKGHKNGANMKYRDAIIIGTAQAIAPFPGISRSGATVSMGLLTGLDREFAVAFSFIMGIPPILAANIMELKGAEQNIDMPVSIILIGVGTALVVGLLAINMVRWLVRAEKFKIFAYYTLVLGVLIIGIGIFERLTDHMIQDLVLSLISYGQSFN